MNEKLISYGRKPSQNQATSFSLSLNHLSLSTISLSLWVVWQGEPACGRCRGRCEAPCASRCFPFSRPPPCTSSSSLPFSALPGCVTPRAWCAHSPCLSACALHPPQLTHTHTRTHTHAHTPCRRDTLATLVMFRKAKENARLVRRLHCHCQRSPQPFPWGCPLQRTHGWATLVSLWAWLQERNKYDDRIVEFITQGDAKNLRQLLEKRKHSSLLAADAQGRVPYVLLLGLFPPPPLPPAWALGWW